MCDIARIHMVVLAFLSAGLLVSISWFERAWNDVQRSRGQSANGGTATGVIRSDKEPEKTD